MADRTKIEWTDASWNPVVGCTQVSAGCDHCYAKRVTERFHGPGSFDEVKLHPTRLEQPLRWKRPRRIFVNSMSDLFHDDIPVEYLARVFAVMSAAPQHTFQVLTKRHGRMRSVLTRNVSPHPAASMPFKFLVDVERMRMGLPVLPDSRRADGTYAWPLPNVWLGVSVEDQRWADIRIPALLATPAAVRFLSCEPLLGPIDLDRWTGGGRCDCGVGGGNHPLGCQVYEEPPIGWVIVGGESGTGARPMHPAWARNLLDQCVAAHVPFLFKQHGEWLPREQGGGGAGRAVWMYLDGSQSTGVLSDPSREGASAMFRVGKKAAGRELDGRTWDEYPSGGA